MKAMDLLSSLICLNAVTEQREEGIQSDRETWNDLFWCYTS
jgi:hypothetical protein